ncbi:dynein light chain type [Colletotrichum karsti]|uniref:Dynein light chain type n=1 Tax=Colletotrichum karsti TaxID=1095194 RepID=A0A9P6LK74_9PEZI|nr:dynein light chain type [Colletotrichum karsti]KAF9875896.1 dynein light chain type [Colletotrichum karsti]
MWPVHQSNPTRSNGPLPVAAVVRLAQHATTLHKDKFNLSQFLLLSLAVQIDQVSSPEAGGAAFDVQPEKGFFASPAQVRCCFEADDDTIATGPAVSPEFTMADVKQSASPAPRDKLEGMCKLRSGLRSRGKADADWNLAQVKSADMTEDMQQECIEVAQEAMAKFTIEKDIAQHIKRTFDERKGPTWHCIVGRNFGSFVTHETKHFIYFYLGHCAILLFKTQ